MTDWRGAVGGAVICPLLFCVPLVVGGVIVSMPAVAAPGDGDAAPITARVQKREGEKKAQAAFVAHRYREALGLMSALYAQFHDPVELRNIGRCHQMLGEPDAAIANFKEYLAEAPDLSRDELKEVQGFIREMEELKARQASAVAAPAGVAAPAAVAVTSKPESASPISAAGTTPPPAQVLPAPPVARSSSLTTPGGPALMPGAVAGLPPPAAEAVSPPVMRGQTTPVESSFTGNHTPDRDARKQMLIAGTAIGAGGVLAVVIGSVYGLEARSKNQDSKTYCNGDDCQPMGKDLRDTALSDARVSTVLFIAGGALIAGGLFFLLRAPPEGAETSSASFGGVARPGLEGLAADLGPNRASLALRGRF